MYDDKNTTVHRCIQEGRPSWRLRHRPGRPRDGEGRCRHPVALQKVPEEEAGHEAISWAGWTRPEAVCMFNKSHRHGLEGGDYGCGEGKRDLKWIIVSFRLSLASIWNNKPDRFRFESPVCSCSWYLSALYCFFFFFPSTDFLLVFIYRSVLTFLKEYFTLYVFICDHNVKWQRKRKKKKKEDTVDVWNHCKSGFLTTTELFGDNKATPDYEQSNQSHTLRLHHFHAHWLLCSYYLVSSGFFTVFCALTFVNL